MARTQFALTSTGVIDVGSVDDLTDALEWFRDLLPATAKVELEKAQRQGSLLKPTVFVDGKKGRDEDSVKPFGIITYADSIGPLREAIALAQSIVDSAAPRLTGWYRESLQWFANGQQLMGMPDVERVGPRGNVQLVDFAPYASTLEISVPRGIIWAAYTAVARTYGKAVLVSYGYGQPDKLGGLREPPGRPALRPYAVPILTLGNPASTVKPGARRPGAGKRPRKRRTERWQGFDKGGRI